MARPKKQLLPHDKNTDEELINMASKNKDDNAANKLALRYLHLKDKIIHNVIQGNRGILDAQEEEELYFFSFMDAFSHFNPKNGKFSTYFSSVFKRNYLRESVKKTKIMARMSVVSLDTMPKGEQAESGMCLSDIITMERSISEAHNFDICYDIIDFIEQLDPDMRTGARLLLLVNEGFSLRTACAACKISYNSGRYLIRKFREYCVHHRGKKLAAHFRSLEQEEEKKKRKRKAQRKNKKAKSPNKK